MLNQKTSYQQIRNTFVQSILCQFLPLLIIGWSKPWLDKLPKEIASIISLIAFILFFWGYLKCWIFAHQYAEYKGYPKYLGLLGILNIFGLSILFFLNNKNSADYSGSDDSLTNFSISAIFVSYLAIEALLIPVIFVVLICIGVEPKTIGNYLENKDFLAIYAIPVTIFLAWYFFREVKRSKVNLQQIIGSLKKINFKLPIGLAIVNYFFASGSSSMILYGLSFLVPKYVEGQINYRYATTPLGYAFFAVGALIFAPIMEELFFRGIIFQKIAVKKDMLKALLTSATLFTIVHFRSDVISLFAFGVILVILYLKTKQIIVPIVCHFFYNLIVIIRLLHWEFFSNVDRSTPETIAGFQQEFIDHLELEILFVVLSAPYLCYFIYKNFPRTHDIKRLPYFANQQTFRK